MRPVPGKIFRTWHQQHIASFLCLGFSSSTIKSVTPRPPPTVTPTIPPITLPMVYEPVTPPIDPRVTPMRPPVTPPAAPSQRMAVGSASKPVNCARPILPTFAQP